MRWCLKNVRVGRVALQELERSLAQADHRNSLLKEELARAQHDLADLKQVSNHPLSRQQPSIFRW